MILFFLRLAAGRLGLGVTPVNKYLKSFAQNFNFWTRRNY